MYFFVDLLRFTFFPFIWTECVVYCAVYCPEYLYFKCLFPCSISSKVLNCQISVHMFLFFCIHRQSCELRSDFVITTVIQKNDRTNTWQQKLTNDTWVHDTTWPISFRHKSPHSILYILITIFHPQNVCHPIAFCACSFCTGFPAGCSHCVCCVL